ncbi:MAG: hypothetical protein R3B51_11495 [Thermodesulfobacteriota bacterium]
MGRADTHLPAVLVMKKAGVKTDIEAVRCHVPGLPLRTFAVNAHCGMKPLPKTGTEIINNAKYTYFIAILHTCLALPVAGVRPEMEFKSLVQAYLAVLIGVGDCDKLVIHSV